ncbi:DUF3313 family protein [Silanimonas sp.]|uniref:DUF3313 family protein n=1 Tax=Silanimonas sp. TaxID=1929290 RepID=UPI001BC7D593|nr:DUF3313 family protein [Silanimonas sp.]MBS3896484.1 DUF3313 family protein [Silanimonas sp.]MBS3924432.1 DUF3313 family protein [Xanthomonadaceae bacterium]
MRTVLSLALAALPAAALAFDQVRIADPAALQGVRQVYVAEVALDLPEPAHRFALRSGEPRPVRPQDAAAQAAALGAALRRGLDRNFELVTAPGPGVLVLRPTLDGLASSRPTFADFDRQPGLSFRSFYAGGASLRLQLERDGRPVAEISDRYTGSLADGMPRIGVWQDSERAFSRWSRQLPEVVRQPTLAAR